MKLNILLVVVFLAKASLQSPPLKPWSLDDLEIELESDRKHPYGFPQPLMYVSPENHSVAVEYETIDKIFSNEDIADRHIVAISITGSIGKGKSFFVDYCLQFMYANYKSVNYKDNPLDNKRDWIGLPEEVLKGFSWHGGAERHTTGVIMWSDVFLHDIEMPGFPKQKLAIVLIDTQGLFDARSSAADNSRIFALSTLISSIQIFNLDGVIQENQLEYLQMATDYAQFHTNISSNDRLKPFQKFLFLIRDWVHPQDYPYGSHGGKAYIRDVLSTKKDQSPWLKNVRDYIYNSFEEIDCFLMPHPGKAVTDRNYNGSFVSMAPEYKKNLIDLIEELLKPANLVRKRILGDVVQGNEFGEFVKTFFAKFQSPDTPTIPTIYETVVERQLSNNVMKAMQEYQNGVDRYLKYDLPEVEFEKSLEMIHVEAKETAMLWYKKMKMTGTKEHEEMFEERLEKEIDEFNKVWKKTSLQNYNIMKQKEQAAMERMRRKTEKRIKIKEAHEIKDQFDKKIAETKRMRQQQKDEEIEKLAEKTEKASEEVVQKTSSDFNSQMSAFIKETEIHEQAQDERIESLFKIFEGFRQELLMKKSQDAEAKAEERKMTMARLEIEDKQHAEEMALKRYKYDLKAKTRRAELEAEMQQRKLEMEDRREARQHQMTMFELQAQDSISEFSGIF